MNWSSPRNPLPQPAPSKRAAQLERILANAKSLLAAGKHEEALAELGRKGGAILRDPVGQMMLGSIHSLGGRPDKALAAFDAAVRMAPKSAQAHFNRGFALKQLGRPGEAAAAYEIALKIDPRMVEARHNLAVALNEAGQPEKALAAADAAIALNSASPEAHYNRGVMLASLGRHEEALAAYDLALKLRSAYPDAHIARASSLRSLKRFDDAVIAIGMAIEQAPARADARVAKALILREANRFDEALAAADEALAQSPGNADALLARAGLLELLQRDEEALATYDQLVVRDPKSFPVRVNRGTTLRRLKRFPEAFAAFEELLSEAPDLLPIQINRAGVLNELDRFEDAIGACDRILETIERSGTGDSSPPEMLAAEALTTRASALAHLHRIEEALADYDRALGFRPDSMVIRADRALTLLLAGRFKEGWPGYEFRGLKEGDAAHVPEHPAPQWTGESLAGRKLLVTGEQGLGDVIQFVRYLPSLAADAAAITLETRPRLHRILAAGLAGVDLTDKADAAEHFDYQIRLLSIPGVRGADLATIPAEVPYLHAEDERVARWRNRLPAGHIRIGIHWQGNKEYGADHRRSFALAHFAPLAGIPGVELISLQKGGGAEQLAALPSGMTVHTLGEDFDAGPDAFIDTAAAMQELDLIVSSDSAVVHLAGALGRPVWILLPHTPDWRWRLEGEDSPWYPTARLFRQKGSGDWESVFERVADEVAAMAGTQET
jgi:tetratricopeptide (TPR) repeat protein